MEGEAGAGMFILMMHIRMTGGAERAWEQVTTMPGDA